MFEWREYKPVTVIIQPNERGAGVQMGVDDRTNGGQPTRQQFNVGFGGPRY